MKIVISSGHGLKVRGAAGPQPWGLDEVDEARRVVADVADWLFENGFDVSQVHDDISTNQSDNLHYLVSQHNKFPAADRLDVSIHFNAYLADPNVGRGTECLYLTQDELAGRVAAAVAAASGLINRGAKYRSDLYFLNGTTGSRGAILVETCFVDAGVDCDLYRRHFDEICGAIADAITATEEDYPPAPFRAVGKVSHFGGPDDTGVDPDEQLAWWSSTEAGRDDAPELFLSEQPPGTTGAARALNPLSSYIAMRFDYQNQWSKSELASGNVMFWVRAPKTGKRYKARPADWGPHVDTARIADISPGLMDALGITTDDEVEITQA
jgi:N-acetylmuramoyl-L-alanine amidase-like protein